MEERKAEIGTATDAFVAKVHEEEQAEAGGDEVSFCSTYALFCHPFA